jgi:HK97 family phage major capsid protein
MRGSSAILDNPQEDILARAERYEKEAGELLESVREARENGRSQPRQVISKYASGAKAWNRDNPFKSAGLFFKGVREIAGGDYRNHKEMRTYIEKALPSGLNETQLTDGGVFVPPEFSQQLLMRTYENDILSRTTLFPLGTGNTLKIPAINETSRADGSRFGGVQALWRSEAGTLVASKPSFAQVSLTVDSLSLYVQVTQELLDDATGISLETFLNLVAKDELAFKIGDAIINGDGVTKPVGITSSLNAAKIAVAKETGQPAATINAVNILKMWARLHVSCHQNAVWLIDQTILPQLSTMTIGSAGSNMVVYMPPGGLSSAPFGTLMGRPVIPTEFGQQLGTEGDIILWDPTTYLTATRQGLQSASSMHVAFLTNEMVYRFILRVDGKPWWIAPLTPKNGGPTQSCVVTLATRA